MTRRAYLRSGREVFVFCEPAERLRLDLAHPLTREPELLADLLERGRPFADEPEAECDHVALAARQLRDGTPDGVVAERRVGLVLGGRALRGEHVAEARVAVGADRRVRRGDGARCGPNLEHLRERQLRVLRDLLVGRSLAERRGQLALRAGDLLLALDDVDGNPDRARLVGDAAL